MPNASLGELKSKSCKKIGDKSATVFHRNERLRVLSSAGRQMNTLLEVPAIVRSLVTAAMEVVGARSGIAGLILDGKMVFTEYCRGGQYVPFSCTMDSAPRPVTSRASCIPMIADDAEADPQTNPELLRVLGFGKFSRVPVLNQKQEMLGCLEVHNNREDRSFDLDDLDFLRVLADMAAIALEHAQALTECDRATCALAESEKRFRVLIENSADGFALLDPCGKILYAGPPVLGYTEEDWTNIDFQDLVHPEDRRLSANLLAEVLRKSSQPITSQFRVRHKDGSWRWVEAITKNLASEPLVNALVINYRDITERRRLEEQFRQAQRMEALGTLAGGVAHDFNNLLTIIAGYGQMMLDEPGIPERCRPNIEEILKASNRAAALTGQLLAFSRRQPAQAKIIDLNNLVSSMEKMLRRVIGEHIDLVTGLSPGVGRVKADQPQIEQVIMNLAVNARDAMPHGGRLRIETRNIDVPTDSGMSLSPGQYAMLAVSDNGCGMDEETKNRLFEPFFTTKEKGKGTGLGLSTVYGIIRQSRGDIWVWSELGVGTMFQIYFPRADEAVETVERKTSLRRTTPQSETVLLVEDDSELRKLACEMLRRHGYRVLEAGDGREALRLAEQHQGPVDLLLTDVVMPIMSGRELVERIAVLRPGLKVLYMSGYTGDVIAYHGVPDEITQTGLLKKPFTADELIRRIRAVLEDEPTVQPRHASAPARD